MPRAFKPHTSEPPQVGGNALGRRVRAQLDPMRTRCIACDQQGRMIFRALAPLPEALEDPAQGLSIGDQEQPPGLIDTTLNGKLLE